MLQLCKMSRFSYIRVEVGAGQLDTEKRAPLGDTGALSPSRKKAEEEEENTNSYIELFNFFRLVVVVVFSSFYLIRLFFSYFLLDSFNNCLFCLPFDIVFLLITFACNSLSAARFSTTRRPCFLLLFRFGTVDLLFNFPNKTNRAHATFGRQSKGALLKLLVFSSSSSSSFFKEKKKGKIETQG